MYIGNFANDLASNFSCALQGIDGVDEMDPFLNRLITRITYGATYC